MTILAVMSYKGGVGKTTTTANLAEALKRKGWRVTVVDLDPQNAVRLHFGDDPMSSAGIAAQILAGQPMQDVCVHSRSGVDVLPFGAVSEPERLAYERLLADQPGLLKELLAPWTADPRQIVLLDTPPGPSVYLQQAMTVANRALLVIHADAGSYATLPAMEKLLEHYFYTRADFFGCHYLLNFVDGGKRLNRDVQALLHSQMQDRMAPYSVHYDTALTEALAHQQTVFDYDPHCQAAYSLQKVADWLDGMLQQDELSRPGYAHV
jgi:cellulose synthase operon protein YhjQ